VCSTNLLPGFLLEVLLFVEVREEVVEHDCVHPNPPDESLRVVAVNEEQLECVDHHEDELDLQSGIEKSH